MRLIIMWTTLLLFLPLIAKADVISEIGGGYKFTYSDVLSPKCEYVFLTQATKEDFMFDGQGRQKTVPCGGTNPIFIGWPVAYQTPDARFRIGWFHMSHWFSGEPFNNKPETNFNCLCTTWTVNWTKRHKRRH
jgi:hypothetical protein